MQNSNWAIYFRFILITWHVEVLQKQSIKRNCYLHTYILFIMYSVRFVRTLIKVKIANLSPCFMWANIPWDTDHILKLR